jgi:hypothetical protein
MRRLLIALAVCAGALVGTSAPPAQARASASATTQRPARAGAVHVEAVHTGLRYAAPGPGDRLAPGVNVLALLFEARKPGTVPTVSILAPGNVPVLSGRPAVAKDGTVCARMRPLGPGEYTLVYTVHAADGDIDTSRFYFLVAPGGKAGSTPAACDRIELPALPGEETVFGLPRVAAWSVLAGLVTLATAAVITIAVRRRRRRILPGEPAQ